MFILEDECSVFSRPIHLLSLTRDNILDILSNERKGDEVYYVKVRAERTGLEIGFIGMEPIDDDNINVGFVRKDENVDPLVADAVEAFVETLQSRLDSPEEDETSIEHKKSLMDDLEQQLIDKLTDDRKPMSKSLTSILLQETSDVKHSHRMVTMYGDDMIMFTGKYITLKFVIIPMLDEMNKLRFLLENFSVKYAKTHTFLDYRVDLETGKLIAKRIIEGMCDRILLNVDTTDAQFALREMADSREIEFARIDETLKNESKE